MPEQYRSETPTYHENNVEKDDDQDENGHHHPDQAFMTSVRRLRCPHHVQLHGLMSHSQEPDLDKLGHNSNWQIFRKKIRCFLNASCALASKLLYGHVIRKGSIMQIKAS